MEKKVLTIIKPQKLLNHQSIQCIELYISYNCYQNFAKYYVSFIETRKVSSPASLYDSIISFCARVYIILASKI